MSCSLLPFTIKHRDATSLPPECKSQGCEGYILPVSELGYSSPMDPLSITASGIAIAGAVGKTASSVKRFRRDYRDADKQILHVQEQRAQLKLNLHQLSKIPSEERVTLGAASFENIEFKLPTETGSLKNRDRMWWAASGKGKVQGSIHQLKEKESSSSFTLGLNTFNEL